MLAKVSVARLSCQAWDASTDQPEKVPAESACPSEVRHWSHPSPVALSPPGEKQQRAVLGVGSGPCGQATIWARRCRNSTEEGTCNKSKLHRPEASLPANLKFPHQHVSKTMFIVSSNHIFSWRGRSSFGKWQNSSSDAVLTAWSNIPCCTYN